MSSTEAAAALARAVSRALDKFADELLQAADEPIIEVADASGATTTDLNLGKRQQQIVEVEGLASEDGIRTSAVAAAIDYEVPNTYSTLQALALRGIVEQVPGKEPQHWRLARRYRPTTEAFKVMAGHVRAGEWTTCGDVSIAVVGNYTAARGVGRAAAMSPTFPAPHRVLLQGGVISPDWHDSQGRGPEECERRLTEEGVRFIDGHADEAQRVAWDVLQRREAAAALDPDSE